MTAQSANAQTAPNNTFEEWFERECKEPLGPFWPRALRLHRRFGPEVSDVFQDILLVAVADGKLDDVLTALEEYCENLLPRQSGFVDLPSLDGQRTKWALSFVIRGILGLRDTHHSLTFPRVARYASAS